jgi:hypothetical protein
MSKAFWVAAIERAFNAAWQTYVPIAGADGLGFIQAGWLHTLMVCGAAVALSLVKSVISAIATDGSPSLVNAEVVVPKPANPGE